MFIHVLFCLWMTSMKRLSSQQREHFSDVWWAESQAVFWLWGPEMRGVMGGGRSKGLMPLCDRAAGIFGARVEEKLGQGCCGGGFGVFHQLLVPSSPDINLCLHPPPAAPPPPPSCWSSLNHVSVLLLLLGCVWLVPSSFPKWLVMHEVSVCMMCWVSIFILFLFSCHLCFYFLHLYIRL